jgi:hypothetical protein
LRNQIKNRAYEKLPMTTLKKPDLIQILEDLDAEGV